MNLRDLGLTASTEVFERFRDGMLRANTLVAGPDPDLAGQVRAAQAIAMLSDPVVLFADAPAGELRAAVLDGVDRLFVTAKPEVKGRRGRPTVMSPETIEAAQRLYDAGHTPADIAAALGVSRATIYRHLPGAELLRRFMRLIETARRRPRSRATPSAAAASSAKPPRTPSAGGP